MIKNIINILVIKFFLILVLFNSNAISKTLPPGSGAGDVKANILILLDTSLSMTNKPFGGAAIFYPGDVVLLDSGDVMVGQTSGAGIVKFEYATEDFDPNFAGESRLYMGTNSMRCTLENPKQDTRIRTVGPMDISKDVDGMGTSEVIYAVANGLQRVVAIDADGNCVEIIDHTQLGKSGNGRFDYIHPASLDIRTILGEDHLIVTGTDEICTNERRWRRTRYCAARSYEAFWFSRNLTTGVEKKCTIRSNGNALSNLINAFGSMALDNGNNVYFTYGSDIYKYPITKDGDGNYCPTLDQNASGFKDGSGSNDFNFPTQIDIDPQDDTVMYATSSIDHTIQQLEINSNYIKKVTTVGTESTEATSSNASINMKSPSALFVSDNRAWIGGNKVSIQEFDISAGNSFTWVDEMGTSRVSRAIGARNAITAVVSDSSLTSGAYFGYGFWNGGLRSRKPGVKGAKGRWCRDCEYTCHREGPRKRGWKSYWDFNANCNYYGSWSGTHPSGNSSICNWHSCIPVGVGPDTSDDIIDWVRASTSRLQFGTDAGAFAQLASEYYNDPKVDIVDEESICQLNYVILVGDGQWSHHAGALAKIKNLRTGPKKVKTIVFAYGGGIKGDADENFKEMAKAGSCDDPNFGTPQASDECRQRIIAESPADLVTKLKSEVERIIASRLSFTAPSITASIQEGGSLYQAQFEYKKHGEWTGHLMKKKIDAQGNVDHDPVWDAAEMVHAQVKNNSRKIWTALDGENYWQGENKYNNFIVSDSTTSKINNLFQLSGRTVTDFHNLDSACASDGDGKKFSNAELAAKGILNGNKDDIKGLINFVRGKDYFVYSGVCDDKDKVRISVLGDIYHSQVVEVGRPSANTLYTNTKQEAYYRAKNGYNTWSASLANRKKTLYVGANDGMLHAFDAATGEERWGFVPPFIASKLPELVNDSLDGLGGGNEKKGGTNAIFAVDGSPVIHDMYIRGINADTGLFNTSKGWHTILMIPYGRGGRGYSVLDVTDPDKPHHIFSVFNDWDNKKIMIAKQDGEIINGNPEKPVDDLTYTGGSMSISESLEAQRASFNQRVAYDADIAEDATGDDFTQRDLVAPCTSNADFYVTGTSACYSGRTFTFNYSVPQSILDDPTSLDVYELVNMTPTKLSVVAVKQDGALAKITFSSDKYFNVATGDNKEDNETNAFDITIPNAGTKEPMYDYSTLGETWSTPRIFRMSVDQSGGIEDDQYVAVLPGGFGKSSGLGSSVFVIDLENMADQSGSSYPGKIVSGGDGLIKIADLDNSFSRLGIDYPDIPNSITGDPVVITPDTWSGAQWRGAIVYVNDYEGKISKINLTSATTSGERINPQTINLFDHTTLFNMNANQENRRYNYFGMDAAYGSSTKHLYLFGATGDFGDIGAKSKGQDNLLYGVKDVNFPNFKMINSGDSGSYTEALNAKKVDAGYELSGNCVNTAEDVGDCPALLKDAWVFKLDKPYNKSFDVNPRDEAKENKYRKASASPTVFKGTVYYPVYEPPFGNATCGVGNAFICSADDECGTNTSENIQYSQQTTGKDSKFDDDSGCYYLQPGVLSKLVVFSNKLFANITTDSEDQADTLISLLSNEGDVSVFRSGWRENY